MNHPTPLGLVFLFLLSPNVSDAQAKYIVIGVIGVSVLALVISMIYLANKEKKLRSEKSVSGRLEAASNGLFLCRLAGAPIRIHNAISYLSSRGRLNNRYSWTQTNFELNEDGIHSTGKNGVLVWYRGDISAALSSLFHKPNMMSLVASDVGTTNMPLVVPWANLKECLVESETGRRIVFLFFKKKDQKRDEWIAVEFFSQKESTLFTDALQRKKISVKVVPEGWLSENYGKDWEEK